MEEKMCVYPPCGKIIKPHDLLIIHGRPFHKECWPKHYKMAIHPTIAIPATQIFEAPSHKEETKS